MRTRSAVAVLLCVAAASPQKLQASLMSAIHDGNEAEVERSLAAGDDANRRAAGGCTPILQAVKFYHPAILELLLKHGGDPNVRGEGLCEDDKTPLMIASYFCQPAAVFALLQHGADAALATKAGRKAIDAARARPCDETTGLIERAGTADFAGWRTIQQKGEDALLAASKQHFIPGKPPKMKRGEGPTQLKMSFQKAMSDTAFPNGARIHRDIWSSNVGADSAVWIVDASLDTLNKNKPTEHYYQCGFVLIGEEDSDARVITKSKCQLSSDAMEKAGASVSPLGLVELSPNSMGALFSWYEDEAGGFWLYAKGKYGWERIANSTMWAD